MQQPLWDVPVTQRVALTHQNSLSAAEQSRALKLSAAGQAVAMEFTLCCLVSGCNIAMMQHDTPMHVQNS